VVAILIFAIGAGISVYEGVHRLMNPQPLQNVMVIYIVKDAISADTVETTVQTTVGEIKKARPLVKRVFIEGEARRSPDLATASAEQR